MNYYVALLKSKQEQKSPSFLNNIKGHYASLLREKYNYDPSQARDSEGKWIKEGQFHAKEKQKKQEERQKRLLTAIEQLKENEEVVVKDLRDDLKQYGVTNDIALKWGYHDEQTGKGCGICHILKKHGKGDFIGIVNAVINGKISEYVKQSQQIVIEHEGYKAILSLNDNGNKKVWLLSGYKIDPNYKKNTKKAQDELASFSAQYSNPTQHGPTFRRPALVACALSSLTNFFNKFK